MRLAPAFRAGVMLAMVCCTANAGNLIVNPDFDSDLSGWIIDIIGTGATATRDGAVGSPAVGSAYLNAPNPMSLITMSQCVLISAPRNVDLIANTYTDSSSGTSDNAVQIESFDAPGCGGTLLETQATTEQAFPFWLKRSLPNHALPDTTQSVRVSFFIDSGNTSEQVHFDHIVFIDAAIFRDGFEP